MRLPALILTVIAAMLPIAAASAQDKANQPQVQDTAKKVKELRKERLAVLKELTDQLTRLYQNGRVDIDGLLEARLQLFHAELDAAEKQAERVTLYKNLVEELKQYEKIAKQKVDAGRGTMASILQAKARRLQAEIRLEEAMAGKAAGKQQKTSAAMPQVKNVTITQQYACEINAHRHITIRALQTGEIETVSAKEGQAVKKGDLIFKIVPNLYKAKLDVELADLKLADLELRNTEKLFNSKVVSANEVALFKAKWERARAKADLAKAELLFTEVRAPFDGLIGRLHEQQGSMIKEGEAITTLSNNSLMWVYFNVPEAHYFQHMTVKAKETKIELVLVNGSKFKQSGKIGSIEAKFNNDTGKILFRADFPNPDRVLRHGMTGNLLIHRTLENAIVIPQRATFEVLGKRYVYVVDKQDVAHRREIVVQSELDDFFVIDRGIDVDDKIIVEGTQHVRDGERVEYEFRR